MYSRFVLKKDNLLEMDDESTHKIDIVKGKIKECKTKISIISGGLIRYLQPLDVSKTSHSMMSWRRGTLNIVQIKKILRHVKPK